MNPEEQNSVPAGSEAQPFAIPSELFEPRGRTFSVINQKGGCGKSTTAINLGAQLAQEGFQVLLVDLDPQANATLGLGIHLESEEKSIYDIFKIPNIFPAEAIRPTPVENLQIIASSRELSSSAVELLKNSNWEYTLRSFLRPLKNNYHFILIDCPPALNALTVNALTASDDMIIPLQAHYFSLEGMKELFLTVHSVREKLNPLLAGGRILPTLFDSRPNVSRELLKSIRNYFNELVFETVIRINVKLIEATMHGQPVILYDPASRGAQDYAAMCREFLQKEAALLQPQPHHAE